MDTASNIRCHYILMDKAMERAVAGCENKLSHCMNVAPDYTYEWIVFQMTVANMIATNQFFIHNYYLNTEA